MSTLYHDSYLSSPGRHLFFVRALRTDFLTVQLPYTKLFLLKSNRPFIFFIIIILYYAYLSLWHLLLDCLNDFTLALTLHSFKMYSVNKLSFNYNIPSTLICPIRKIQDKLFNKLVCHWAFLMLIKKANFLHPD